MDEEQYYNPIISAFLKSKELAQQAQQAGASLEQRKKESEDERKRNEELLKQGQERIANEHESQVLYGKLAQQHHELESRNAALEMGEHLRNLIAGGVGNESAAGLVSGTYNPGRPFGPGGVPGGEALPGSEEGQPQTVTIPGIPNPIPVGGIPGPAQMLQQKAQEARTLAEAQGAGQLPSKLTEIAATGAQAKDLHRMEEEFRSNTEKNKLASEEFRAKLERETQIHVRQIGANAEMYSANLIHGITPEQMQSGVYDNITGGRTFKSDNIFDRNVQAATQQSGARSIDPKDIEAYRTAQQLVPFFQKLRDFADTQPSEAKMGTGPARLAAMAKGELLKTPYPSQTKEDLAEIAANTINVGKQIEGQTGGRVPNAQLALATNAIVSGQFTKEENYKRIQNLEDMYVGKNNVLLGGAPDWQVKAINQRYKIKPSFLQTAPNKNVSGHTLDEGKSIELGQPVYK